MVQRRYRLRNRERCFRLSTSVGQGKNSESPLLILTRIQDACHMNFVSGSVAQWQSIGIIIIYIPWEVFRNLGAKILENEILVE